MGRAGVLVPLLVMSALLVPACGSASPAPVTTLTVRVGGYTQVFGTPLPADPAQASVIEGFRTAMILWDKSQETTVLVSPVVIAGADRFFKTRAVAVSATSATITTCDDGSKFEEVNPGTGVPDPVYSATANQRYLFETWQMTRLGGHWAISDVTPVTLPGSRAKPCQP